jgi:hypothetical protein
MICNHKHRYSIHNVPVCSVEFPVLCFSEKVKKTVKAKDSYGLVFDRVKRSNAMKLHNAERGDLNLQHGTIQGLMIICLILISLTQM